MLEQFNIAINAQIEPNSGAGGVESVLIGLISALGKLNDGSEQYTIIGNSRNYHWLKPYVGPNQTIVCRPEKKLPKRPFKRIPEPLRTIARNGHMVKQRILQRQIKAVTVWPEVAVSDGFYESLGCDLIHFPYQHFEVCAIRTVYNPHDLQHRHYPHFFTPSQIVERETFYPAGCRLAHTVVAASRWIKQDIVKQYNLHPAKIQVIPWAPPTQAYSEPLPGTLSTVRRKYQINEPFAFYPAMTWKHKNHIQLLEALALLRDRHKLLVNLVCTGYQNGFWPEIERTLSTLGLQNQVKFLGIVSPEELRAFYRLAQFVVVPTLFEAASGPIFEAWQDNSPVTCSNVTSLPEQAGDGALLFDPFSVEAIAQAIAMMATDADLREDLRRRGARRLQDFSWERTAKAYRAVYRRVAGQPLSEEDHVLLNWDWMCGSHNEKEAVSV